MLSNITFYTCFFAEVLVSVIQCSSPTLSQRVPMAQVTDQLALGNLSDVTMHTLVPNLLTIQGYTYCG